MHSHEFVFNNERIAATVENNDDNLVVKVGDKEFTLRRIGDNLFATMLNGKRAEIAVVKHKSGYYVDVDSVLLDVLDASDAAIGGGVDEHGGEKDKVYAPMPGKIVKVMVAVGDEVAEKQPLVIVEAMKMENQINSPAKGKVKAVNFSPGDQVDTESPIVELELAE
jgi:pyruvate carboxylase subunit B